MKAGSLLWVMNSASLGGSGLWVLDAVRSLEAWSHQVIHLDGARSSVLQRKFATAGVELQHIPGVTRGLLASIKPDAVVLSNTAPANLEGPPPWNWLTESYLTISVHHSLVGQWIPGVAADIFVSRYLFAHFVDVAPRMRRVWIVPPGIHTAEFASLEREPSRRNGSCVTGRVSSINPKKFPRELYTILDRAGCRSIVVGGRSHFPDADPRRFDFPAVGERETADILRELDIFVYRSGVVETWCRAVTEAMAAGLPVVAENRGGIAEQIEHGVDGFLCDSDEQFVEQIRRLADDPQLRARIGRRAREKAIECFDVSRFKSLIEPLLPVW